jgi:3-isopropylmalate dehydrogenase
MPAAKKRVAVIPGDGIGREVIAAAVMVLRAAAARGGREIELTEFDWGADRFLRDGTTLPDGAVEMFRREYDAILGGAFGDPRVPSNEHAKDILLGLRTKLDLYVNLRPCRLLDRRLTPWQQRAEADVNFVVVRENTEGLYCGRGETHHAGTPEESATEVDLNTRRGVERILRYAFEYARAHGLARLVMADKANVLTHGHGLWRRVLAELREQYPQVHSRAMYVDALAMELVRQPQEFQVIVTCNLFGDILSDLGAALMGGLGMAPSGNIRPGEVSLFEPVHGSAPGLAGKNRANPMAAVLSAAMLCRHIGWEAEAESIEVAVAAAVREGKITEEVGGTLGTREAGDWLANRVSR